MSSTERSVPSNDTLVIRSIDIGIVLLLAPAWIPLMCVVGAAVLVSSGRPILFAQDRIGLAGARFSMLKFRSMLSGENTLVPDPTRITAIGRLLRRTSLDELPQLVNVLRGDMSLVGPRPMLPEQFASLSTSHRRRASVRPGLTGLAQVNGRNRLVWNDRLTFDLRWALEPTTRMYLATLCRTARVVIGGEGISGHDPTDPVVDLRPTSGDSVDLLRIVDFDLVSADPTEEQRAA